MWGSWSCTGLNPPVSGSWPGAGWPPRPRGGRGPGLGQTTCHVLLHLHSKPDSPWQEQEEDGDPRIINVPRFPGVKDLKRQGSVYIRPVAHIGRLFQVIPPPPPPCSFYTTHQRFIRFSMLVYVWYVLFFHHVERRAGTLCSSSITMCKHLVRLKIWSQRDFMWHTGWFFYWSAQKTTKCQTLTKFWHLELFWWDLLCNLTLSHFLGRTSKKTPSICFWEVMMLKQTLFF